MLFSLATSFLGVEGGDAFRQHQAHNQGCRLHRLEADLVGLLPSVQSQHGFWRHATCQALSKPDSI